MIEFTEEEKSRLLNHVQDTGNPHLRPALFVEGSATLDFGSVGSNGVASLTLSVPGAVVGRPVLLSAPAAMESGFTWCGTVTATDTVTIRIHNNDGGSVDPIPATWGVAVLL